MARIRGGDAAAIASPGGGPTAWNTYVWVDDADGTARKVRDAGGSVLAEPADAGEFGRMAAFADPQGAAFRVWQANRQRGAAIVNEHGSVNFNDLRTTDLEGAARFYGAVFGWELLHESMWALPAYGDFLEGRTPGLRENIASMGAPPRFEEVVASAGTTGERPRWEVTFAVDDADAIAEKAAELGGEVLTAPHDGPWVRTTVIRDPQGATFTASKFVPENKDLPAEAGVSGA
jgi:predicted enzyme related to lactoylglutathione lyase